MTTREVPPEELRMDTEAMIAAAPNDIIVWLKGERNLEVAQRGEAFAVEDKVKANHHDGRANRFAEAIREMTDARSRLAAFAIVLGNRILVALKEAKQPEWHPTHRHYKGTLYRVTGTRMDANGEELIEGVEYDDATGKRYFLHRSRWDGNLESGKPRYQVLIKGDER